MNLIAVGNNRRKTPEVLRRGDMSELANSKRRAPCPTRPPSHHRYILDGNLGVTDGFEKGDVSNIRLT
jgi:hypothetical protein